MPLVITPLAEVIIQLSIEALLRGLYRDLESMTDEEKELKVKQLQADKTAAMAELDSH